MTEQRRGNDVDGDDDESVPISMRDMELEPVSLVEIEKILAPGRTPPVRVPPAPKAKAATKDEETKDAAPRKRIPTIPRREPSKVDSDVASIDLRADSATIDLAALSAATAVKKPAIDEELAQLTSVPPPPMAPPPAEIPGLVALSKPLQRGEAPKPPKPPKKREADSLPEVPPEVLPPPIEVETKHAAKALSSRPPPLPAVETEEQAKPAAVARTKPVAAAAPAAKTEPEAKSSSKMLLIVAGAIALLGGGYWIGQRGDTSPQSPASAAVATPSPTQTVAPTAVATTTPEPPVADAMATSEPVTATASAEPTVSTSSTAKTLANTTSTSTTTTTTSTSTSTTAAASVPVPPTAPATDEPGGDAPPFDKSAASAAMNSAAGNASACKQEGDPSGSAHVTVTFAPSGRATQAMLGGPPYQGTATGSCIARAFKAARVPAFSGAPVTVSKTVNIR